MNYLVIRKAKYGYDIHSTGPEEHNMLYVGYSLRQAEQCFRKTFNYIGCHFAKLYIYPAKPNKARHAGGLFFYPAPC